jgi:TonB-linked SusC/RagA family outer membrane protein
MRKLLLMVLGLFCLSTQLLAQNRTVTGTVADSSGQGLPGVSVRVQGTNIGTTTNQSGAFSLSVPQTTRALEVSSIGYVRQTITIPASGSISVSLRQETGAMNEVVVTGYTRQRRGEYSGAGTKVQAAQINSIPSGSLDQILQGRAPGLLVTVGSGQPGAAARVQIRGQGSISGGSDPLYVIDGVPVEGGVFQSINPNDIESVDVLRDASATALYGNRGGAGVIVVTTKRGRTGQTSVTYSGQSGITQPGKQQFEMMNSAELLQFQEMLGMQSTNSLPGWLYSRKNPANAGATPATLAQYDRTLDSLRGINTNWKDVFLEPGQFQQHDINLSGGSGKTTFFTSFGYYDEEGIGLRSDMRRFSFRSNIDHQTEKFTGSIKAYAGYTKRNFIESENSVTLANPFAAAYLALPYHKLNQESGLGLFHQLTNPSGIAQRGALVGPNAYDRILNTTSSNNQLKANINFQGNYQITKNVNAGGFLGLDFRETITERMVKPYTWAARSAAFPTGPRNVGTDTLARGSFGEGRTSFFSYITRGNVGYRNTFATRHEVDVQTFVEYTRDKDKSFTYTGYGLNEALMGSPAAITPGNTTNALIAAVGGARTERSLFAAIATAKYTLDKKYTVNLSIRRDATSQLPEEFRYNTFYSVGATWNVMRENFAANWKTFNDLRLRASYGTSASADNFVFGNFGYLPTYGAVNYIGGGTVQGLAPTNAGNPDVTWEEIATFNIGVDFGLLKNRITGSLDVYNKRTIDNIISQNLSLTSGFTSQSVNAGIIRNRGVELQLSADVVRTRNFTWTVGGNIAYNQNEVLDLNQVSQFVQGTELVKEGLPLGSHYIVKWGGVDAATGRPLYYDSTGKLTTTFNDVLNSVADFGTYNAPWIGGFSTGFKYKGFSLDAFFTFQQGFSRFNNQDFFQLNHAFAVQGYNLRTEMLTMWQKPGDVTDIQSPIYQRQFVSKDIQDASFIRFRNLNLSYEFGQSVVNSLKVIRGLKIFAQGQNLYTWTKWSGFDPEDDNNIAQYEYPTARTITFGLNVNFK